MTLRPRKDVENHVIIAGFGRVGQMLGRVLSRGGRAVSGARCERDCCGKHRSDGLPVFYGDASRVELLRRNRAEAAAAVVVTIDDWEASERVVRNVRSHWPELPVYVRARDQRHAKKLMALGATDTVPEALEGSLQLGLRALSGIGMPDEVSLELIDIERQAAAEELRE